MNRYEIIGKLLDWQKLYNFQFELLNKPLDWLCEVKVQLGDKAWLIVVYDEFHDLSEQKPLVTLYLILMSLEDYHQTSDYLEWLKEYQIKQARDFIEYYKSLATTYIDFQQMLGPLDALTNSWDYQHRSGEYAALLALQVL